LDTKERQNAEQRKAGSGRKKKMEIHTQLQIHQAIEHMRTDPEFPFDTHDDFEDILTHYGIEINLDQKGEELLRKEIRKITGDKQTAEILELVHDDL
jgi:hypothetical protein